MRLLLGLCFLLAVGCVSNPPHSTRTEIESGAALWDDDPKTRNGGLIPSRDADIREINLLLWERQTGKISDRLWKRMMERNPKLAEHFSELKPIPEGATVFQLQEPVRVRGVVDVYNRN